MTAQRVGLLPTVQSIWGTHVQIRLTQVLISVYQGIHRTTIVNVTTKPILNDGPHTAFSFDVTRQRPNVVVHASTLAFVSEPALSSLSCEQIQRMRMSAFVNLVMFWENQLWWYNEVTPVPGQMGLEQTSRIQNQIPESISSRNDR